MDLSSGALPGSDLVARVMPEVGRQLRERHLQETGYHPGGLPELRAALAARITAQGLPTRADQVLITAGSQQAVWLIATALAGPGTSTLVEDPSYRGALEALAAAGGRLRGVPCTPAGTDPNLLEAAVGDADLLYVQTALHNPTGIRMPEAQRGVLADMAARHGTLVVDDQSQSELGWFRSDPLPGLERMADPERLLIVGTLSKLFWGCAWDGYGGPGRSSDGSRRCAAASTWAARSPTSWRRCSCCPRRIGSGNCVASSWYGSSRSPRRSSVPSCPVGVGAPPWADQASGPTPVRTPWPSRSVPWPVESGSPPARRSLRTAGTAPSCGCPYGTRKAGSPMRLGSSPTCRAPGLRDGRSAPPPPARASPRARVTRT
ncbi:aminotransferase class I/II-fold pyridoxal phosphate-dependent enzyme [Streptomyces sp. NPDC054804]